MNSEFRSLLNISMKPRSPGRGRPWEDLHHHGLAKFVPASRHVETPQVNVRIWRLKWRLPTMVPCCSIKTVLINPAIPETTPRCPTFVLTDPCAIDWACGDDGSKTSARAANSIGSPSCVPLPCASMYKMSSAAMLASAKAEPTPPWSPSKKKQRRQWRPPRSWVSLWTRIISEEY